MNEEKNNDFCDEMLKRIDEKDGKSLKRLKMFSWIFFLIGLETINFMVQMEVNPIIIILTVDLFALVVAVTQHKIGIKTGLDIGEMPRKLDRIQSEKTESLLWKRIIELQNNQNSGQNRNLIPFGYIDRLYFVSMDNDEYILYDDRKIRISEPDEKALSVAKMAWEDYQKSIKSGE